VHLLFTLRQDIELARFCATSRPDRRAGFMTFPNMHDFAWQKGYGAFTVSHSAVDDVKRYIANQEEHHKTLTFQDELRFLLQKHGIEFDEKYLWE
jgi:hypothetical protein